MRPRGEIGLNVLEGRAISAEIYLEPRGEIGLNVLEGRASWTEIYLEASWGDWIEGVGRQSQLGGDPYQKKVLFCELLCLFVAKTLLPFCGRIMLLSVAAEGNVLRCSSPSYDD